MTQRSEKRWILCTGLGKSSIPRLREPTPAARGGITQPSNRTLAEPCCRNQGNSTDIGSRVRVVAPAGGGLHADDRQNKQQLRVREREMMTDGLMHGNLESVPIYILVIYRHHRTLPCIWFLGNMTCSLLSSNLNDVKTPRELGSIKRLCLQVVTHTPQTRHSTDDTWTLRCEVAQNSHNLTAH